MLKIDDKEDFEKLVAYILVTKTDERTVSLNGCKVDRFRLYFHMPWWVSIDLEHQEINLEYDQQNERIESLFRSVLKNLGIKSFNFYLFEGK